MPGRSLATRIAFPAGFFVLVSVGVLGYGLTRSLRTNALEEAMLGSESVGETVLRSIEHEMRVNERDAIRAILVAVGAKEGIEHVRLYNKDGEISFSARPEEVGATVDLESVACVSCHAGPDPLPTLEDEDRSRVFVNDRGQTVMGSIWVIRNRPSCQGAGCHSPVSEQSTLGVLDVAVSLEPALARVADAGWRAFGYSLAAAAVIMTILYTIVWRSVRQPLDIVVSATRRLGERDRSVPVPPGAAREIAILAGSFNEVVENLNSSRSDLQRWAESLSETVAEKARELTEARFQVVQAEKLSSVGLVAAGIAHELNSPLMAIITYAHLVRRYHPEDEALQNDVRMIEQEANRCAAIIRQLLDYSRKQSQDQLVDGCSVRLAVDSALDLLKVELQNAGVTVAATWPEHLPPVSANDVQLMQVFVNLFMNAMHAMPDGGTLEIMVDVCGRSALTGVDLPPHGSGRLVRIRVRDSGTGIEPESLRRVFDPFFTTKPVGKGSGLGLSVSLGIVRSYRGTIVAESRPGEGSTFTVILPEHDASPEA